MKLPAKANLYWRLYGAASPRSNFQVVIFIQRVFFFLASVYKRYQWTEHVRNKVILNDFIFQ